MNRPLRPKATRGRRAARFAFCLAILWPLLITSRTLPAAAEDAPASSDVYVRVIVETAPLRTGPNHQFRIARVAARGESFVVRARASHGYWFEVSLSDGSRAFVQGDMVQTVEVDPPSPRARRLAKVFAPPPLLNAHGEIAVMLGALGESGFMAVRPNILLAPTFGIEAQLAASVGASGRLFMGGLGGLVNLFPNWPIVPFFVGGAGAVYASPNADSFVLEAGTRAMLYGGGGLRIGFKHHITLRIEARGYALFEEDNLQAQQEVSCGLAAFF